jgi:hypothetical protein
MSDPNMRDFYGRVGRIEDMHRKGYGFEADGTLGMSHFRTRQKTRRVGWLMPLALVLGTVVMIKAAVLANIGPEAYTDRVARLSSGSRADKIGAYVLQADPLTVQAASLFKRIGS